MIILPTSYLGPVSYFSKLLDSYESAVIDGGEHYLKQSIRSRCTILGANGPILLSVPVLDCRAGRTPIRDVRIDEGKGWRHRHWISLVSAYRNSPYFEHYAGELEPVYTRPHTFLWDLNEQLFRIVTDLLGIDISVERSETFFRAADSDTDLRDGFSEKPRLKKADPRFRAVPYYQVFSEKFGFTPDLSIVDLLFCEGPSAAGVLRKCVVGG